MQYSTKKFKHDLRLLNEHVHADNNMYHIRKKKQNNIQITTIDHDRQFGKSIVVTVGESTIIIQPDLPFPETKLRHVLPKPNNQLIHDLKQIFEKYQNWYFDH